MKQNEMIIRNYISLRTAVIIVNRLKSKTQDLS